MAECRGLASEGRQRYKKYKKPKNLGGEISFGNTTDNVLKSIFFKGLIQK
jgi:hypothetical protein